MNRKTKIWAGVTIALAVTALTGCTSDEGPYETQARANGVKVFEVDLEDGRTILCIGTKWGYAGGLSCDWTEVAR